MGDTLFGTAAREPQLDVGQAAQLYARQLQLNQQHLPATAAIAGQTSRDEYARNMQFGLGLLTNPAASIYGPQIQQASSALRDAQQQIAALQAAMRGGNLTPEAMRAIGMDTTGFASRPMTAAERAQMQAKVQQLGATVTRQQQRVQQLGSVNVDARVRAALPEEYRQRDALLREMDASRASTPEYLRAQEALARGLETGEIGDALLAQAAEKARSDGTLNAQAERDAVQAARAGMAARGMATGNAGLAAELLNRDAYARQRQFEDLGFAQGVYGQDLARRTQNIGMLGQSAGLADAERVRQLQTRQNMYNFTLQTNPRLLAAGLGTPFANMTQPAMGMISGAQGLPAMYSGGQQSQQGLHSTISGLVGAGFGAYYGGPQGAAAGYQMGTGLGDASSAMMGGYGA